MSSAIRSAGVANRTSRQAATSATTTSAAYSTVA
jgi:hypothetical protein